MRAGDRATGYESRARMGVSGITGGTGEGHRKDHSSIITGSRGVGPGGTRETTIGGTGTTSASGRDDRGYTFATTREGHDMGHASASTTIPTSTVTREYVSEPGIKESNTNVKSYMTGLGAGPDIGTSTIPGTGTGTGTGSGTRMYTAGGDSLASRARADPLSSREIRDVDTLSIGKDVNHGARTHTTSNDATAARMTGDIGTPSYVKGVGPGEISTPRAARNTDMSSYGRDVGSSGIGLRVNEDDPSSMPRMDSDRLSYIKEIADSLRLGAEVHGDDRSHLPGKVSKVTTSYNDGSARPGAQTAGQPYSNKDMSSGVGPSRGPGAGTRRYTIGGDTYSVGARGDANRIGDIASTTGVATKTTDSRSREDNRRVDQRTPAGGRRASHTGTKDQSSTLSYIKDAASALGIGSSSGSGTGESYLTTKTEDKSTSGTLKDKAKGVATGVESGFVADTRTRGDGRAYTSGDTPSTRIGDSKTFITGEDSTLSRMGGESQTYPTSGDTSAIRPSDSLSYIKETAGISPGGTDTEPGYDPTSTTARITLTPSRDTERDTNPDAEYYSRDFTARNTSTGIGSSTTPHRYDMVGTVQAPSYSKDFALGSSSTYANTPSTMETRSGAHVSSYGNREAMTTGSQDASGRARTEGYTIIHPAKVTEDQVRARERTGRGTGEAGTVEQRIKGGREQPGRQGVGERYIIGGKSMGDSGADRREGETRTMQEPGGQPSGSFRDDASAKHDRIRLELEQELHEIEQEALRIARGKETRRTTGVTSPGQKYSSLVGSGEPSERKRDREDMAGISTRDRQEVCIPGDFDAQERYDRGIVIGEAESSARNRAQHGAGEVRDDAAATPSQVQPGKLLREPTPLDSERRQQQELCEPEVEKAARESSMERHRTADLSSGPGGMRTTMRGSPEYREQRASDSGRATTSEKEGKDERGVMESRFEGDDDEGAKRGILGRAADKMGHLLKA